MAIYIVEINGQNHDGQKIRRIYEIEAKNIRDAKQKAANQIRSEVPRIKIMYNSPKIKG